MFDDPELGDNLQALEELADMGYFDRDTSAYGIAKKYFTKAKPPYLRNKNTCSTKKWRR